MAYDLEFERPLADIEKRIAHLQRRGERMRSDDRAQVAELQRELNRRTEEIYSSLTPWQRVQVARFRDRPYTNDYIKRMCDDYFELRGDRRFADDRAIQGGVASVGGQTIVLLGTQKGRDLKEREECNFGMAHPEGYRKALRLFRYAERFHYPVVTLIDTTGAYPGLGDEERGISQAIAENLLVMAGLRTPIVCIVIGEGGSGGALGIGVGDRVLMLENAVYTVAAPEAAASIIWRDNAFAPDAAEAMKITAPELLQLGIVDGIIPEPLGGAHRDYQASAENVKSAILRELADLKRFSTGELLERRYQRFRVIGLQGITEAVAAAQK
ncbi:MAG TPA: acetyl-CoA carboxylase carboxyltransferase subunit alpha [Ktedonobacterales bacterium]|jgi:acetyl-CoA carboxylase carboxyl transferase subunit alpha|nr:acetyl-CoA carboxylase carboxyltransferase subunit alpha [Ktedonobacterales bacterium]